MMRKMKDSGVEWIGVVPEDWEICRLRYIADIQTGNTPSKKKGTYYSDDGLLWVKPDNLNGFEPINKTEEMLSVEGSKVARVAKANATLVCCIGSVGKIGYSLHKVAFNQQINSVEFDEEKCNWKFGLYYLSTQESQHKYYMNGNVVYILNSSSHKNIMVPYCSMKKQLIIVNYLDSKCAEIDSLIQSKEKTNEKLKEYRHSVIYEAVTKGLDKNSKMKDSGVKWIGEIPEGWNITYPKYLCANEKYSIVDGPFGSDMKNAEYVDAGVPIIQLNNIGEGFHDLTNLKFITEQKADELVTHTIFPGDIVIAKMMPAGRAAIVSDKFEKYIVSSDSIRLKLNNDNNPEYFMYCFNAYGMIQASLYSKGTTRIRINLDIVKNTVIACPPYEEQCAISKYLDSYCAKIDSIISTNEKIIDQLKEYRQSIIYEAVTGKIEVS